MIREPQLSATKSGKMVTLEIYDDIGPSYFGMIDAKLVSAKLAEAGSFDEIDLRINSRGGSAYDGFAIYNALKMTGAKVTASVIGLAASAASIILMAGEVRRIPKNAFVMIHEPVTFAYGGDKELKAAMEALRVIRKGAVSTYVEATGLSEKKIAEMLAAETWMTGDEALEMGFATEVEPEVKLPESDPPAMQVPSFITRAPEQFSRLVALCAMPPKESLKMTTPAAPTKPEDPPFIPHEPKKMTATASIASLAAPLTPAAPQLSADDVAKAAADAVKAERTRISEVTNLCKLAGHPEMAQKHIDEGTAPADVQKALFSLMVAERKPVGGDTQADPQQSTGDAKYEAEFNATPDVFVNMGITKERYINSRRIDDGLPPHPKK